MDGAAKSHDEEEGRDRRFTGKYTAENLEAVKEAEV